MRKIVKISIFISIVATLLSCFSIITNINCTTQMSTINKHQINNDPRLEKEYLLAEQLKQIINDRWSLTTDNQIFDNSTHRIITDETNVWFNIDAPDGEIYIVTAEQLRAALINRQYTGNIAWEKPKE